MIDLTTFVYHSIPAYSLYIQAYYVYMYKFIYPIETHDNFIPICANILYVYTQEYTYTYTMYNIQ